MLGRRAEPARLGLGVDGHLFEPVVEDPDQAGVPANPQSAAHILRRRRVVRFVDLEMTVAMNGPIRLMEEGEPVRRQRQQRAAFTLLEHSADLPLRRSVDARVGDRLFPP